MTNMIIDIAAIIAAIGSIIAILVGVHTSRSSTRTVEVLGGPPNHGTDSVSGSLDALQDKVDTVIKLEDRLDRRLLAQDHRIQAIADRVTVIEQRRPE